MKLKLSKEWFQRAILEYGDPEGCAVCGALAGCCSTYPNCEGNKPMEDELKPSVAQMLQVGYSCGLSTLDEAYSQYMSHYECFFLIDKYQEQYAVFVQELKDLGFTEQIDGVNELLSLSIDACAKIMGIPLIDYPEPECQPCPLDELSVPLSDIELQKK